MTDKVNSGFTTVELMVAIGIVSILAMVAVPGLRDNVRQHRLSNQISDVASALQLAQSEAVTRARSVVMCASSNSETSAPSCGTNTTSWSDGYVIFVDPDNDGVLDPGEVIVRVGGSMTSGFVLSGGAGFGGNVSFDGLGRLNQSGSLVLCDAGDIRYSRAIMLGSNGRVRISKLGPRGIPLSDGGSEINTCTP